MVAYFVITVFLSASLLFSVQPMVAKSLLPVFGGTSAVWTTCMLFYQTVLLLGYLYAHFVVARVSKAVQLFGHTALLVLAIVAGFVFDTPVAPPEASSYPIPWLIGQLALVSGLPFFMISSAGPLVQSWFARTGHPRAHDPYFLYAASNAGSLLGLMAYPFVVEPTLGIGDQRRIWLIGFGVFTMLTVGAILMSRGGAKDIDTDGGASGTALVDDEDDVGVDVVTWKRRLRWVYWGFVPSSMLLGVTSYLTTDVASLPLLWVVPLAVYLVTMIVAFAVDSGKLIERLRRPLVVSVIASMILILAGDSKNFAPAIPMILVQLFVLTLTGLMGHGMLAHDRPHAGRLTEFYLIMSIGGALGGVFNGVVSPLIFDATYEYHIVLLCALSLLPWIRVRGLARAAAKRRALLLRFGMPVVSLMYVLTVGFNMGWIIDTFGSDGTSMFSNTLFAFAIAVGVPALLTYLAWKDGLACLLVAAAPLAASVVDDYLDPRVQFRERTFYGVHSVVDDVVFDTRTEQFVRIRTLMHGTTNHGVQYLREELEHIPLGYYHRSGPCGAAFALVKSYHPDGARMGVLGLGGGAMASHARDIDTMRFFEIDPTVAWIAQDSGLFTYLDRPEGVIEVVLGDGRLVLEREREAGARKYDILVMDAFSSDSIPVHLVTREALELYFERLREGGVLLIHISNRHLDLAPLIRALGYDGGAYVLRKGDFDIPVEEELYRFPSVWMALTKDPNTGQDLIDQAGFIYVKDPEGTKPDFRVWTDQYSNMLSVLRDDSH
jgi:hypothetical protein